MAIAGAFLVRIFKLSHCNDSWLSGRFCHFRMSTFCFSVVYKGFRQIWAIYLDQWVSIWTNLSLGHTNTGCDVLRALTRSAASSYLNTPVKRNCRKVSASCCPNTFTSWWKEAVTPSQNKFSEVSQLSWCFVTCSIKQVVGGRFPAWL